MSSPSRIQHPLRAEKRGTFNQKKTSRQPQNTIFRTFFLPPDFPPIGNIFSNHWKTTEKFFQSLEKPLQFFQPLANSPTLHFPSIQVVPPPPVSPSTFHTILPTTYQRPPKRHLESPGHHFFSMAIPAKHPAMAKHHRSMHMPPGPMPNLQNQRMLSRKCVKNGCPT